MTADEWGSEHYRKCAIQPRDFITANKLGFSEGNVIKYICRWRDKNGTADLLKAANFIAKLLEEAGSDVTINVVKVRRSQ